MPLLAPRGRAHLPVCSDPFGFLVDDRLGDLRQGFVGCFLFIQRFLEQRGRFIQTEFFGPCAQGAVARDFVVLDRLRGGQETGVEGRGPLTRS